MDATRRGECNRDTDWLFGDDFPSVVAAAHELKSPLVLIRQLSLMLENGDVSETEKSCILEQITLTSERALRLTSDLTRSIRLSDALFNLEPINPQKLCKDVICELTPLFSAHNRNIKLVARKRPPLLVANRDLLKRIIMNFSDNALHYTEDNTNIEIKVDSLNSGNIVRLGVRDHGPSLSINTLKLLREKISENMPSSVHVRPQSSGLGLYIANQFAKTMNGKIGMIRHRDGSTFYLDLQSSRQLSLL